MFGILAHWDPVGIHPLPERLTVPHGHERVRLGGVVAHGCHGIEGVCVRVGTELQSGRPAYFLWVEIYKIFKK